MSNSRRMAKLMMILSKTTVHQFKKGRDREKKRIVVAHYTKPE